LVNVLYHALSRDCVTYTHTHTHTHTNKTVSLPSSTVHNLLELTEKIHRDW